MLRALDPLSRLACRRLLVSLMLVLVWAGVFSPQALWAGVALLSSSCAVVVAVVAALRRERPLGASLNRWDEAAALIGLHCLARLLI